MQKKWLLVGGGFIFVVVITVIAFMLKKNPISQIKESEIATIEVTVTTKENYVSIDSEEKAKITEIMEILNGIQLRKSKSHEKDGMGAEIIITMNDGSKHLLLFLEDDVSIDGKYYIPDKNYVEIFREIVSRYMVQKQ
ncbi:MAG: hypothetical protein IJA32_00815 [Lachnospiraceae bacterium]|nr:hypothetical protein [Lachnospiraceae bacterium]